MKITAVFRLRYNRIRLYVRAATVAGVNQSSQALVDCTSWNWKAILENCAAERTAGK